MKNEVIIMIALTVIGLSYLFYNLCNTKYEVSIINSEVVDKETYDIYFLGITIKTKYIIRLKLYNGEIKDFDNISYYYTYKSGDEIEIFEKKQYYKDKYVSSVYMLNYDY